MSVQVDVELNEAEIRRLMSAEGDVGRAVRKVADRTVSYARSAAPVDQGTLRGSIHAEVSYSDRQVRAVVSADADYALYVHEGTGVYGPRGRPIRPKRAQFLVFPSRRGGGRGGLVFAREVQGQRPNPFLLEALRRASPWPVSGGVR